MNYDIFLSDLFTSLPEVSGAFLFAPQAGIIAKQLNKLTSSYNPLAIGEKVSSIAEIASEQMNDISQIEVNFGGTILSCRLLPDQNLLFLLHTPELSGGMIRMALQMALNNSNQGNDTPDDQADSPVEDMAVTEPAVSQQDSIEVDTEALMASGSPLAAPLNKLQDEFANFIGPVAVLVFQDILITWCQEHTPSLETMKYLVPLIDNEIEDAQEINEFHNNIKDLFPQE